MKTYFVSLDLLDMANAIRVKSISPTAAAIQATPELIRHGERAVVVMAVRESGSSSRQRVTIDAYPFRGGMQGMALKRETLNLVTNTMLLTSRVA